MGMLPVAHRYMGMLMHSTRSMDMRVLSLNAANIDSGTKTVISPAMISPRTSHLPMSAIISTKPYCRASLILWAMVLLPGEGWDAFSCVSAEDERSPELTSAPPMTAVTRAAIGRTRAKGSPMME